MRTEILISLVLIVLGVFLGLNIVDARLKQQQKLDSIITRLDAIEYRITMQPYEWRANDTTQ